MVDHLKSCPFCGGDASAEGRTIYAQPSKDLTWDDGTLIAEAFYVNCIACSANNKTFIGGGYRTKEQAIEAWNMRIAADASRPDEGQTFSHDAMIAYGFAAYCAGWKAAIRTLDGKSLRDRHVQHWLIANPPVERPAPNWRFPVEPA
jgi:hypothetical protein